MDLKPCTVLNWISTKEQLPPQGTPVWFWSNLWIDLDFNPEGIREGFYSEDGLYTSYGWDPCFDAYTTCEDVPKMWALRCPPGSEKDIDPLIEELAEKVTDHYCKDELLKEMAAYIHDLLTKVARYGYDFQLETEFEKGKVIMQKYREQVGE